MAHKGRFDVCTTDTNIFMVYVSLLVEWGELEELPIMLRDVSENCPWIKRKTSRSMQRCALEDLEGGELSESEVLQTL